MKYAGCAAGEARLRRSPCGERGLKCFVRLVLPVLPCGRSPCGERGLKYDDGFPVGEDCGVAPRAGSVG